MSTQTLNKILEIFEKRKHLHLQHETIKRTSIDAAKTRNTALQDGAKALILITPAKTFIQVVIQADMRADLKKIKKILQIKNISLASPDQVLALTDCVVGSVPPMGVLWNVPVIIDVNLFNRDQVVFSAGTLQDSIITDAEVLKNINSARVADIAKFPPKENL